MLRQVGDGILSAVCLLRVVQRRPLGGGQVEHLLLHGGVVVELVLQLSLTDLHLELGVLDLFELRL